MFCKREINEAIYIVEQLFPSAFPTNSGDIAPEPADSTSLDRLVISMSGDLIDDMPASDPRWLETLPASQLPGQGS